MTTIRDKQVAEHPLMFFLLISNDAVFFMFKEHLFKLFVSSSIDQDKVPFQIKSGINIMWTEKEIRLLTKIKNKKTGLSVVNRRKK